MENMSHLIFSNIGCWFHMHVNHVTLPPIIMEVEHGDMGEDVFCGLSPNGLFSTSMIMGGRVLQFSTYREMV